MWDNYAQSISLSFRMLRLSLIRIKYRFLFPILCAFLLFSSQLTAAEVLQVRSSSLLEIGDQNRGYTIKLSCLSSFPEKEEEAKKFLKSLLPRGQKVNFKPRSSNDGMLIASVSKIDSSDDLTEELIRAGFGKSTCLSS